VCVLVCVSRAMVFEDKWTCTSMMVAHRFIRGDIPAFCRTIVRMSFAGSEEPYRTRPAHELYAIQSRCWSYDKLTSNDIDCLVVSMRALYNHVPNIVVSFCEWLPVEVARKYINDNQSIVAQMSACRLVLYYPHRFSELYEDAAVVFAPDTNMWLRRFYLHKNTEFGAHCAAAYSEKYTGQMTIERLFTLQTLTRRHGLFLKYCNQEFCLKLANPSKRWHGMCPACKANALEALDSTMREVAKCAWPRHISELVMDIVVAM